MANQVGYGFRDLRDIWNERVADNVEASYEAIDRTLELHNQVVASFTDLFVERTVERMQSFKTANHVRNQPLDEFGRARKVRPAGQYRVELPMFRSGNAIGGIYEQRIRMTVQELGRVAHMLTLGDLHWMRDHIMAAIFNNGQYTWTDEDGTVLTVKPLANNDTDAYNFGEAEVQGGTDNHYSYQPNPIGTGADNPYPILRDELTEHPENTDEVIAFIPTDLETATASLPGFTEVGTDPDIIQPGTEPQLRRNGPSVSHPGVVIGKVDEVWVVRWRRMPAGYIVAVTAGGDAPIAQREFEETVLQGYQREGVREDWPYSEEQWVRRAGFGGWNRTGAAVRQIGAGSYTPPTLYANMGSI